MVSSVIGNRRAFYLKSQTIPKPPIHLSSGGVNLTVTPMVTTVTSNFSPPNMSFPTPSTTSSGSTSHPVKPNRGPPRNRCQTAASQGARFKANRPLTSQAVLQIIIIITLM